jgi:hypothetical protein
MWQGMFSMETSSVLEVPEKQEALWSAMLAVVAWTCYKQSI